MGLQPRASQMAPCLAVGFAVLHPIVSERFPHIWGAQPSAPRTSLLKETTCIKGSVALSPAHDARFFFTPHPTSCAPPSGVGTGLTTPYNQAR